MWRNFTRGHVTAFFLAVFFWRGTVFIFFIPMSVPTFEATEEHHVFLEINNSMELFEHINSVKTFDHFTQPKYISDYMEEQDPSFVIDEMVSSGMSLQRCLQFPANEEIKKEAKLNEKKINDALITAKQVIDRVLAYAIIFGKK